MLVYQPEARGRVSGPARHTHGSPGTRSTVHGSWTWLQLQVQFAFLMVSWLVSSSGAARQTAFCEERCGEVARFGKPESARWFQSPEKQPLPRVSPQPGGRGPPQMWLMAAWAGRRTCFSR